MTLNLTKTNSSYTVYDSHVHIYPDKIAEKASIAIGEFYHIKMNFNGSVEQLLSEGKAAGIDRFLVHSVATTPKQVHRINEFLKEELTMHSEFIGFMTLNPDMTVDELEKEVEFGLASGFKGIKLHPDFQHFYVDGARAENIYSVVRGRLPILFHAGDKRYDYSKPFRFAAVAKKHPELTMICAHFGGYSEWDNLSCYEGLKNIYFDTSSSLFYLDKNKAKALIEKFGYTHFFFGTDYPMWSAKDELERFFKLDLTETEIRAILSDNLKNLLKL